MITVLNKGGPVMYLLLICSWLSLTIVLERAIFWIKMKWTKNARITEKSLTRGLDVLSTIITLSPLLGILGTVIGIISSFQILGSVYISTPKEVTAGIAQALLTTAFGLAIAIFTLIPYNFYTSRAQDVIEELNKK